MQTGASQYATLVVGRFIGGIVVGMLSMVVANVYCGSR